MIGVTLHWAEGSRYVPTARVVADVGRRFFAPELTPDGRVLSVGDRGLVPEPLVLEVDVQGNSWSQTRALASTIIEDAQRAGDRGHVETARGLRAMRHFLGAERSTDGTRIILRLSFLPMGGEYA